MISRTPGTGTIGVTAALILLPWILYVCRGAKKMGVNGYILSLAPRALIQLLQLSGLLRSSTFLRLAPWLSVCSATCMQSHRHGYVRTLASTYFMPVN